MRPVVERRYVFMGALIEEEVAAALAKLSQVERNLVLSGCIEAVGLEGASGRLGPKIFTLVGGEDFGRSIERVGRGNIERQIRDHIRETIQSASTSR